MYAYYSVFRATADVVLFRSEMLLPTSDLYEFIKSCWEFILSLLSWPSARVTEILGVFCRCRVAMSTFML